MHGSWDAVPANASAEPKPQFTYEFVPRPSKPTQEFRASFGHLRAEVNTIVGRNWLRPSPRIFLAVKPVKIGPRKRATRTELFCDFVMLLIPRSHRSDPSDRSFCGRKRERAGFGCTDRDQRSNSTAIKAHKLAVTNSSVRQR